MKIHTISARYLFNVFTNCYLLETAGSFFLIDSGMPNRRKFIKTRIRELGCGKGDLKMLLITHGDKDHLGNAAYLKQVFGGMIGMHREDAPMAETGRMFGGRGEPNPVMGKIADTFMRLEEANRFKPDVLVEDGESLKGYGLDAEIVLIPGHTKGSIGILTPDHDLFCGDLFANTGKPNLWSLIDSMDEAKASVEKLKKMGIKTVYPGHGKPFEFEELLKNYSAK